MPTQENKENKIKYIKLASCRPAYEAEYNQKLVELSCL